MNESTAPENNLAFIDGQNLHLGAKECGWMIDHKKFRIYLREKYRVSEAYYFLGFMSAEQEKLYENLQKAGFILSFREHSEILLGHKKGNVDSDIIFAIMKKLTEDTSFEKIIIVSNDGDYKKLVDFLIEKDRFEKILFPRGEFSSSLYRTLEGKYFDYLDKKEVRAKIEYK